MVTANKCECNVTDPHFKVELNKISPDPKVTVQMITEVSGKIQITKLTPTLRTGYMTETTTYGVCAQVTG